VAGGLADWYQVHFDDGNVYRRVAPPKRESWSDQFRWDTVVRVCFRAGDLFESDELIFFTSEQEPSYLIPMEAGGGRALLDEVMRRNLIPPTLMIKAAAAIEGIFCWPPLD
jgi:hypothetical protein